VHASVGITHTNGPSLGRPHFGMGSLMFIGVGIAVLLSVVGRLVLALVALIRADSKDIPDIVRGLACWWHRWTWHRKN
jgi:hypothetical protein